MPELMSELVGVPEIVAPLDHGVIKVRVIALPQEGGLTRKARWPALKFICRSV